MSYRGVPNWPPTWTKRGEGDASKNVLCGEIGTLAQVLPSSIEPDARVFLVIEFRENDYMGTLLFKDGAFCRYITGLLQNCIGKSIKEIGDLELSSTL
jgi:hypothetical protein